MAIADAVASGRSSPDGLAYDLKTKLEEVITELNRITLLVPSLSASELAVLDGVVAGTVTAGKAVIAGTGKVLDELDITLLKIGTVDKTAALADAVQSPLAGLADGYRVARGVASITGSGTVVTGLTTVVAVIATAQDDLDGDALAGVSATIGDQAGTPAAGSVILKAWKVTTGGGAGNPTLIAATAAKNVNWLAIGT